MTRMLLLLFSALLISQTCWADPTSPESIDARTAPIGHINVDKKSAPVSEAKPQVVKKRGGKEIYNTHCAACHSSGVAGAPKFANADDWKPRLKKGLDAITTSAINGINAMPKNGTCNDCSREDIKATIEYMLPKQ